MLTSDRHVTKSWEVVLKIFSENSEALAGIGKILKKNLSACTEKERKISDYIEQMLNGDIGFENYIDIRKIMR